MISVAHGPPILLDYNVPLERSSTLKFCLALSQSDHGEIGQSLEAL